jgi:hypothetical protein
MRSFELLLKLPLHRCLLDIFFYKLRYLSLQSFSYFVRLGYNLTGEFFGFTNFFLKLLKLSEYRFQMAILQILKYFGDLILRV